MKIGIFGCTADPFTIAHKAIVEKVLDEGLVDKVLIVPTIVTYHRVGKTAWLDSFSKIVVIQKMLEDSKHQDKIFIDEQELRLKSMLSEDELKNRRYYHTLQQIKEQYGANNELYTIIGTDSLTNFKTWYKWEELLNDTKLICVDNRDGVEAKNRELAYCFVNIDPSLNNVSASAIRSRFSSAEEYLKFVKG